MRGILGPGINGMNIYTVRQATEGLARFMDTQDPETRRRGVSQSHMILVIFHQNLRWEAAQDISKTRYSCLCV